MGIFFLNLPLGVYLLPEFLDLRPLSVHSLQFHTEQPLHFWLFQLIPLTDSSSESLNHLFHIAGFKTTGGTCIQQFRLTFTQTFFNQLPVIKHLAELDDLFPHKDIMRRNPAFQHQPFQRRTTT